MTAILTGVALAASLFGLTLLLAGLAGLVRRRPVRGLARISLGLLFGILALASGAIGLGTQGYRSLVREERAATVEVQPLDERRFEARFRFEDGTDARFELAGDELYVDAHILKWKPLVNLLGLHTHYELDRVAGRYVELEAERSQPRTVFSLAEPKPFDLFHARRRFPGIGLLVDAEYGSATFIVADRPSRFEILVSTSGLLIREARVTEARTNYRARWVARSWR